MNDKLNQTGIKDTKIGDHARISIKQKIILPSVPKGHWCSLIKGEKRYGVRLRGNGEIIKT
jgi:hypothetical protein